MIHRFILAHSPRGFACLGFNHVHSKCLFRLSVFPLYGLRKLENHTVVVNVRGVFLITHRWCIFPGAPCVCWLLFQTISTSLIILISHFHTWIPLFSRSPDFLFCIGVWNFSPTPSMTEIRTFMRGPLILIFTLTWQGKVIMWKQNNSKGKFPLACSKMLLCEPRDARPHRYSSRHC